MKILIFGASGMLGHRLMLQLSKYHEVYGTVRRENFILPSIDADHIIPMIHSAYRPRWNAIAEVFHEADPDVVINCIATIPQRNSDVLDMLPENAEFPHYLVRACKQQNARLIHFSTDAVFSGKRGNYTEDDEPDGNDTYALTKRLGEITDQPHVLTLRCCPIGRELGTKYSLVEWFLAQTGEVKGYQDKWFSPLSTHEIARILNEYVLLRPDLHGVYHLRGIGLSKHDLLWSLRGVFKHHIPIVGVNTETINRTLNGKKFQEATGWTPHTTEMLEEMAADNALYEKVVTHGEECEIK